MTTKPPGRRPTHRLKVFNKRTEQWARVGAGWLNPDGSISIVLNLCTHLIGGQDPDLVFTLFPVDLSKETTR